MKRHKTKPFYKGKCLECGKEVIISAISPNKHWKELTGIWVRRLTDNGIKNVGFLCQECINFQGKKYVFGFGGGNIKNLDLWEAYIQ